MEERGSFIRRLIAQAQQFIASGRKNRENRTKHDLDVGRCALGKLRLKFVCSKVLFGNPIRQRTKKNPSSFSPHSPAFSHLSFSPTCITYMRFFGVSAVINCGTAFLPKLVVCDLSTSANVSPTVKTVTGQLYACQCQSIYQSSKWCLYDRGRIKRCMRKKNDSQIVRCCDRLVIIT